MYDYVPSIYQTDINNRHFLQKLLLQNRLLNAEDYTQHADYTFCLEYECSLGNVVQQTTHYVMYNRQTDDGSTEQLYC